MEAMVAGGDGVARKEKINMELGRNKAWETKVHLASTLVFAKMMAPCHVPHGVQLMHACAGPGFPFTPSSASACRLVPGAAREWADH